jgi:hypothetical protein
VGDGDEVGVGYDEVGYGDGEGSGGEVGEP